MTKSTEESTSPPSFTFHLIAGPLSGTELRFTGDKFRVGRTKTSNIQIKDTAVSEKHAELIFSDGKWQIRDLGSSNGTLLNGVEIKSRCLYTTFISDVFCWGVLISFTVYPPISFAEKFLEFKNGDQIQFGTETVAKVEVRALTLIPPFNPFLLPL